MMTSHENQELVTREVFRRVLSRICSIESDQIPAPHGQAFLWYLCV